MSSSDVGANSVQVNVLSCEKNSQGVRTHAWQFEDGTAQMRERPKCRASPEQQIAKRSKEEDRRTAYLVWKGDKHERMSRPDVQVVRVHFEGGSPSRVCTCGHTEFHVFMGDVLLLEIHAANAAVSAHLSGCREQLSPPHEAHHLSPHVRVAAVGSDAEIEMHMLSTRRCLKDEFPPVVVGGREFVLEAHGDTLACGHLVQETLVEKRAVDGIDALDVR